MVDEMRALKIEMEGMATSFRYPYFSQGVQPTYEVPPPATLYGHICSAIGYEVDPADFRVGFHFTHETRWMDYEHTHLHTRDSFKLAPTDREILFRPRLTLYLDKLEWAEHFRQPRYVVVLGRSQDLMRYTRVQEVTLRQHDSAYIEHTIVPLAYKNHLQYWTMIPLPRYINRQRQVSWGQYALLTRRQMLAEPIFCDEQTEQWRGAYRGVAWLSLID